MVQVGWQVRWMGDLRWEVGRLECRLDQGAGGWILGGLGWEVGASRHVGKVGSWEVGAMWRLGGRLGRLGGRLGRLGRRLGRLDGTVVEHTALCA